MKPILSYFLWIICLCASQSLWAQTRSLTDSTETKPKKDSIKYGENTTLYFYENEVVEHLRNLHFVDTSVTNFHRYNPSQQSINTLQDLGMLGSATRSIYYQMPKQIGATLGYNTYEPYLPDPDKVRYYNTLSPFTDLTYIQGGKGRTLVNVELNRNFSANWNIGIAFRRIEADKVIGRSVRENDLYTTHQGYMLHTNYFSPTHRYKLMAHYSSYEHLINESGGYRVADTIKDIRALFDVESEAQLNFNLLKANNLQSRRQFHLYHQYALFDSSSVQLFHKVDWSSQLNRYTDENFAAQVSFYPTVFLDTANKMSTLKSVAYTTNFNLLENTVGVKGQIKNLYYRGGLLLRQYELKTDYLYRKLTDSIQNSGRKQELQIVGAVNYRFTDSLTSVSAEMAYLPADGNYRLKAEFLSKWISIKHEMALYKPSLTQKKYYGTFFQWDNDFQDIRSQQTTASFRLPLPSVTLNPYISYLLLNNYVYFDQKAQARQTTAPIQIMQIGMNATAKWNKFHNQTHFILSRDLSQADSGFLRMPKIQITSQFYYESYMFKNNLLGQIGIDLHWKSAYLANAYMPANQQFYLQDKFTVENFLVADLFFNFKVGKALLFLKLVSAFQDLLGKGYYTTPPYFAQARSLELGINWRFYD
jgi:Putative porin